MRNIIWFFALILLLVLQNGILVPLHIISVNLVLIVVAIATLLSEFNQGLIITLMGGLITDFMSGLPDGVMTISFLLAFLILHFILNEILAREANRFILGVAVLGSTLVYFFSVIFVSYIFSWFNLVTQIDFMYLLSSRLPLLLLWNLIFTYPILMYYTWIQNLASRLPIYEKSIRL
ncbi:MAG: hypothetical protein A3I07_01445 [Candidatus Doudnabacteria bacterium RIFCSPLOWO2_02_FULL_42_9]|uniref:Rod shape-determining protein MreD n=1 Tax=Candidatus Doudnabacteria bacterium RIFCSPHIGHO2_01_FULL_41_86 TaxID=1817821 RepID=A0A1F5N9E4_9BACT|nr:MAG: hypothetical protein A2717_01400 [Candidatus Doudnabacteria bacterium RIFCSPHIGHO2_01_FULL_41_86]OGE74881.1 MAG: hypothetical protein A3K07_02970 [Candidatus Doudnabacteria bacterium RIFCSPHIGHO2_01_43_10]OGE85226.1 MAG: hypothetical protein A3E28_00965 [Candidatus Doudnabacteria bacterium RIFCSPHIGHO2_12_FULL_42_22]OGE86764.1 MAG: hypothetical protein A3C49_01800 [Candidatus Doudnabacteria bacterium RIFCSPHIGHO2_02_FULL_42_25]OGE92362.1 MAG: hypothetical protein A2895_01955 [Candidatus